MKTNAIAKPTGTAAAKAISSTPLLSTITATATIHPTITKFLTSTRANTSTPFPTFPPSTPEYLGTTVSLEKEVIGSANIHRLSHVAQWGRGMILGTAFSPDGTKFVVGSAFGLAVFDMNDLNTTPAWIPFDEPDFYEGLAFNQEGKYLRLDKEGVNYKYSTITDFSTGRIVDNFEEQTWINVMTKHHDYGKITINSPDGTKQLRSHITYDEENMNIDYSIREVYDVQSEKLLYKLPDETFYVTFNDVHQPEACDWESTVVCGNAADPVAFAPYAGAFSPINDTLTVLYRSPGYGYYNRFSVLRIYDARNGRILGMIGNFEKPIQTFSYSPDGTRLLIAYVDGSIQLWNIHNNVSLSGAWYFNDYLKLVEFTEDDQYLLMWRPGVLEIRSIKDGSLRSRFDMVAYSLSPTDSNIMAIAGNDNVIRIVEIDSAKTIVRIPAHEYKIFSIQFSSDGRYIASSGQDCKIKLWDAKTGKFLHYFEETRANGYEGGPAIEGESWGNSRIFIYSFYFIEGTNRLMGFGSWGTMVNWDIDTGATNYVVYSTPMEFFNGMMTVSPHYPSSFSVDPELQQFNIYGMTYDLQTGKELRGSPTPESISVPEGCSRYGLVTKDGELQFSLGYHDHEGQVCVLDTQNYKLVQLITLIPNPNYNLLIDGMNLSHDGKTLVVASSMGTVDVYRVIR